MTELQEPITLTTPLCGLGEDYEPEIVLCPAWRPGQSPPIGSGAIVPVFLFEQDMEGLAPVPTLVERYTIPALQRAIRDYGATQRTIGLYDAAHNLVRTWPV